MTNSNDRLDQIALLLQQSIVAGNERMTRIEEAQEVTQAQVNGLVQTITEFSIKTEARLNKLDEAIADIRITNVRLELILRELTGRNGGSSPEP